MKDCKDSPNLDWAQALIDDPMEFPEDPDFKSESPKLSARHMIEISERYLPASNSRPDFVAIKMARVFDEPFEL